MTEKWKQRSINMNFRKAVIIFLIACFVLAVLSSAVLYGNFHSRIAEWEQAGETGEEGGELDRISQETDGMSQETERNFQEEEESYPEGEDSFQKEESFREEDNRSQENERDYRENEESDSGDGGQERDSREWENRDGEKGSQERENRDGEGGTREWENRDGEESSRKWENRHREENSRERESRERKDREEKDLEDMLKGLPLSWGDFALLAGSAAAASALGIWYWILGLIAAYRKAYRMGVNGRLAVLAALFFNLAAVAALYLYCLLKGSCANCGRVRSGNGKFCARCGRPFKKECPQCGQEVDASSVYCRNCGTKLDEADGAEETMGTKEPGNRIF